MRLGKIVATLIVFVLSGCDCEDRLQRVCPAPVPCTVPEGLENTEENIITDEVRLERINEKGECRLGITSCDEELRLICVGYVHPQIEACDSLDNNCDGEIDEGFDQDLDGYTVCQGDCNDTDPSMNPSMTEICNGIDDNCDGYIPPIEVTDVDGDGETACYDCDDTDPFIGPGFDEICDLKDNDCNGLVDDDVIDRLDLCGPSTELGQCQKGRIRCVDGETICWGADYPSPEVCDNIDNNCNGQKDEDIWQQCSTECGVGLEYCSHGGWVGCTAPTPQQEICDGFDNDCDGTIDEDCECIFGALEVCAGGTIDPITFEVLNCGVGLKECDQNGEWGPCIFVMPVQEQCNDYDDDCDGEIDGIVAECADGDYDLIGECKNGITTCTEGSWGSCEGAVGPVDEVCNELDDDCDGEIDEELNAYEKVDIVFAIDGSYSMCSAIDALAQGIGQYVSDFEEADHRFGLVIFPGLPNPDAPVYGMDPWILITDLTDVNTFISMLGSINCSYGGAEPSRDVVYDIADPTNPIGLSWRSDAYPYIILMTDEEAQTFRFLQETGVSQRTNDCQVGSCVAGDRFEFFVFTAVQYFTLWDDPAFFESERLISLYPIDAEEYANKLRNVFTNVCL